MAVVRPPVWKRPFPVPVSYAVQHERSSPKFAGAFAAGCGGVAVATNVLRNAPMALFGSPERWDLLQAHIRSGQDWYYADHGYFRRGRVFRIARNRYQSLVDPLQVAADYELLKLRTHGRPVPTPARFKGLSVDVAPDWKRDGTAILICPNSPTYMKWFGHDAKQWAIDVARELAQYTDRPVIIRWKAQAQRRPFYVDVHDAWATVVFSSGAAIESLTHGVPVFVLAPWATSRPMGLGDLSQIETPYYPDYRIPFLWELAERQWTIDEIRAGVAWKWFMRREEESI